MFCSEGHAELGSYASVVLVQVSGCGTPSSPPLCVSLIKLAQSPAGAFSFPFTPASNCRGSISLLKGGGVWLLP